ncbi:hypothetical protein B2G71_09595 [Novosphingobium sp. PC22D]|uniref:OmpA family protein n=1 Tax=Novosphingobium sp. PC22D TaxID=1962403 RepID=UPI000BF0A9D6|nr:OmpA family protein [Novosphingobium sp. PC22D]PEQ13065.1 hypothetical protein B2G71_09595 [Novosphingobium sp. PC22D]
MSDDERKDARAAQFKTVFRPSPLQDGEGEAAPLFGNLADPQSAAPKAPPPVSTAPPAAPVAPMFEQPAGYERSGGSIFPWILSALLLIALGFMVVRYVILAPGGESEAAPGPAAPAMGAQAERLSTFLAPEIAGDGVEIVEDDATVRARVVSQGLFKSGSSEFEDGKIEVIERIGKALEQENAKFITVEGYSSGEGGALGQARAEAVAAVLRDAIADNRRIAAKGIDLAEGAGEDRIEVVIARRAEGAGS